MVWMHATRLKRCCHCSRKIHSRGLGSVPLMTALMTTRCLPPAIYCCCNTRKMSHLTSPITVKMYHALRRSPASTASTASWDPKPVFRDKPFQKFRRYLHASKVSNLPFIRVVTKWVHTCFDRIFRDQTFVITLRKKIGMVYVQVQVSSLR